MTVSAPRSVLPTLDDEYQVRVPNSDELVRRSGDEAAKCYAEVGKHYLGFRRTYYHESQPSLATTPPSHDEINAAEVALLAESALRLLPGAIKAVPLLGGFLEQLEQVANIHSMSERERTALHNMAMMYLHGVNGGIQPWYVEWLLASAQRLSQVTHPAYYMAFPWDGVLYLNPATLTAFTAAVRAGDIVVIERTMRELAGRLVKALDDPIGTQPALAFTGPDSERRQAVFDLKTGAVLALATYLVAEEVRMLWHPRATLAAPASALAPYPPEIIEHMVSTGQTRKDGRIPS